MKIKNTFWFRHFLMCSRVANLMMQARGWKSDNFARLILESENGCFGNDQMTIYFEQADEFICELHCSEPNCVFDFLKEDGVSQEDLANLTVSEIDKYYNEYCVGTIDFSNLKPNNE